MKKSSQSNPIATIAGVFTLAVIARSAKHCMKKYALKPPKRKRR